MSTADDIGKNTSVRQIVAMILQDDVQALDKYAHLSVVTDVGLRSSTPKKLQLTEKQEEFLALVEQKYKKAGRVIRSIFKHGINIFTIRNGINPFADVSSNKFMSVACEMLLKGGFTRKELREQLESRLEWTTGTAQSHVLVATHALIALGIVEEQHGKFEIKQRASR